MARWRGQCLAILCCALTAACWRSHGIARAPITDASLADDAGHRSDAGITTGVRCGRMTCMHAHACVRREGPEMECVPVSRLPPPPPEGLGRFFPEYYEVRFCDDAADCPEGTECLFWLGEAFVFACGTVPDLCDPPSAPQRVCEDDTECPACRPTCLRRGDETALAACSF